jgi:hypothetical protein
MPLANSDVVDGQIGGPDLIDSSVESRLASLRMPCSVVIHLATSSLLTCFCSDHLLWTSWSKHLFDLFKRFASRLGIREVELDGGEDAESAEDDEEAISDVLEAWRYV